MKISGLPFPFTHAIMTTYSQTDVVNGLLHFSGAVNQNFQEVLLFLYGIFPHR